MTIKNGIILPAPFISGADENNVIDKSSLTEDIILIIPRYQTPTVGDAVTVFFNTHSKNYILTTGNLNNPIMVEFSPATLPAGNYGVYYEVVDTVGNKSASNPVQTSVIDHPAPALPLSLPIVEGATAGQLDLSALPGGMLVVDIPASEQNLQPGDALVVFISNGGSVHQSSHTVVQDMPRHTVKFAGSLFSPTKAFIWYTRLRAGVTETSPELPLSFLSQPPVSQLSAPVLPQASEGTLNLSFLTEPVVVEIPVWQECATGDSVQLYVGNVLPTPHVVMDTTRPMHFLSVDPATLSAGTWPVYYTVTPVGGTPVTSQSMSVVFLHEHVLREPVLTGAEAGHVLEVSSLTTDYIEMVIPAYNDIARGDIIRGYIGNHEATPHIVVQNTLDQHTLHFNKSSISVPDTQPVYYTVQSLGAPLETSSKVTFSFVEKSVTPQSIINRINVGEKFRLFCVNSNQYVSRGNMFPPKDVLGTLILSPDNIIIFCKYEEFLCCTPSVEGVAGYFLTIKDGTTPNDKQVFIFNRSDVKNADFSWYFEPTGRDKKGKHTFYLRSNFGYASDVAQGDVYMSLSKYAHNLLEFIVDFC